MAGDNFQDNVKLGTDGVLSNDGPAIAVGTGAGAKSIILSNDVGALHIVGNPTANHTISLPDADGTLVLQSNVLQSLSAGTTRITSGQAIFSNSNGVSFGIDGQTITASVNAGAGGGVAVSAGTQSVSTGTVVFSNSHNVSFGMSGSSQVTASASFPAETPFGISAGTQSVSTGTMVFSDSNGISFGMSGSSRITASYTVPAVPAIATNVNAVASAGSTGTVTRYAPEDHRHAGVPALAAGSNTGNTVGNTGTQHGTWVIAGTNGITVSGSTGAAGVHTAWLSGGGGGGAVNFSGGTTSNNLTAITFDNANGVSFGLNGSTMTASVATSLTNINVSAGTTSNNLSAVTFSNSNNVSFGINGSVVTASASSPAETPFGVSAGTQSVSTGTLVFSNSNNVSFGMSGSSRVTASIQPGVSAIADGNGSTVTSGVVVFSAVGGNVNFGLNGSTMTAICDFAISAGTQSVDAGTVRFSNSNGVSFGMSGSSRVTASVDAIKSISAGTTRITSGEAVFSNSNGVSFGVNGNTITASVATSLTNINVSAGTTSNNLSALVFSNSNGVTFGLNGSTVTASASPPPAAGIASVSAGTTRVTSGELVFSNSNGVSFGVNGQTITATVTPGAAAGIAAVSAGTQVQTSGTLTFGDSNGISFGLSGSSQITASYDAIMSISAGTTRATSGEVVWSNSNGVSFGLDGQTMTASTGRAVSYWDNARVRLLASWSGTSNSISVQRMQFDYPISATRADVLLNISGSASGALSVRVNIGLYTQNVSTLNSVSTTSLGFTFQSTSAVSYTLASGPRSWTMPLGTWRITPGEYFLAVNYGWTTASTNTVFIQMYGAGTFPTISGVGGVAFANNTSAFGTAHIYNAAQSTLPAAMSLSGMTQTGNSRQAQPYVAFYGTF